VNIETLETFCEVVRQRSFSRGGDARGLTQSAASQCVAHLEKELQCTLIYRDRRPLEVTPEGQILFEGSVDILYRYRALRERLDRQRNAPHQGTVRLASIYSAGLHSLNPHIQSFMGQHPELRVRLEYLLPHKVYAAVLNDEADLGVVSYPKAQRELEVRPWLDEEMVVVCPRAHRLAGRASCEIEELSGERFVAFDSELEIRHAIDRTFRAQGVNVQIVSEIDNIETIKNALEILRALSILPRASIAREVERGVLFGVPLAGVELRRPVGIIYKKRRPLAPTALLFLEELLSRGTRGEAADGEPDSEAARPSRRPHAAKRPERKSAAARRAPRPLAAEPAPADGGGDEPRPKRKREA
jgi:DNA-binding transcriptional LysR family regulator